MEKRHSKRIFAGHYTRYDGKRIFVVRVLKDIDTGEDIVLCEENTNRGPSVYFTMTKASFCEQVLQGGEYVDKYSRKTQYRISSDRIRYLREQGLPASHRREVQFDDEYCERRRRVSPSYHAYAKDLCENYRRDLETYRLCRKERQYIGVSDKKDFAVLKEDLLYLRDCLKTVLKEHYGYFKERFYEGKSIRKYAAAHGLNRGSVDYLQKKLFSALASALRDRDTADGKKRIIERKNIEE